MKRILFLISFSLFGFGQTLQKLEGDRFRIDLRYATSDNFLKRNIYGVFHLSDCYLRKEMVEALKKLDGLLREEKLKLIVWDCYRPVEVQKAMWKLVPDPRYVADPKIGSNHNRGAAIDVALINEKGVLLKFPSGFDDFSEKAHHNYICNANEETKCANRDKLKNLMLQIGLRVFPTEWWHYELQEAEKLPILFQRD